MWNLWKMVQMSLFIKWKQARRETNLLLPNGKGRGGYKLGVRVNRYPLLYMNQINKQGLLYNTRNYSVQSLSRVQLFATPWTVALQASLSITNSESAQTHAHWVSDVIQPSHPLSSPSPPAPNPFQHQGLFKWVSSSHKLAKILEFQLQHQSFKWIFRTDFL